MPHDVFTPAKKLQAIQSILEVKNARAGSATARGSDIARNLIRCANSFTANTKVWVSKTANEITSKAKSILNKVAATSATLKKVALTSVAISSLIVGSQVLAHNEQRNTESIQTVTAVHEHIDPIIVTLQLETSDKKLETITTTPEHPFYALLEPSKKANGIWVNAGELQPNNWLRRANGETGIVKKLEWLTKTKRMYNLSVARDHTFFVGDGQWLVHNTNPPCPKPVPGNGTLTQAEVDELQAVSNKWCVPINVVGSRASGNGRNVNTNLPPGKGEGTRSDIDIKVDGQAVIDSRGRLADDIKNIGAERLINILGNDRIDPNLPVITINPTDPKCKK